MVYNSCKTIYKLSGRRDIRLFLFWRAREGNKDGGSSLSALRTLFLCKNKKTEREREEEEESLETAWAIVAGTGYAFWMRFIISIICYLFKNDNAMGLGRRAWWMKGGTRGNLSVSPMTGSVVSFIFTLLYPCNLFEIFIFKIIPRCLTAFAKLRISFPPLLTTLF